MTFKIRDRFLIRHASRMIARDSTLSSETLSLKKTPNKDFVENASQPSVDALAALVSKKSSKRPVRKGVAARTVAPEDVAEALDAGDKKVIQAWIDEGGDVFADAIVRPFPAKGPYATRNAFALMIMARRGLKKGVGSGSPWLPFLKKNEQRLREMPGFNPNSAAAAPWSANPALKPSDLTSPLHCAVEMGDAQMAGFLLDLGADPNLVRASWRSLLSQDSRFDPEKAIAVPPLACVEGATEVAFVLLRRGAVAQGGVWDTLNSPAKKPSNAALDAVELPVEMPAPSSAMEAFLRNNWGLDDLREAAKLGADPLAGTRAPGGSPVARMMLKRRWAMGLRWLSEEGATSDDFARAIGGAQWIPREQALSILQDSEKETATLKESFGPEAWERSWAMPLWPVEDASLARSLESRQGTGLFRAWNALQNAQGGEKTVKFSAWEALCSLFDPTVLRNLKDNGPNWHARRAWPGMGIDTTAAAVVFAGIESTDKSRSSSSNGFLLAIEVVNATKGAKEMDWSAPVPNASGTKPRALGDVILDCHKDSGPHPMIRVAKDLAAQNWAPDSLGDWEEPFGDNPAGKAAFAGAFAAAQAEMLKKMVNEAKNGRNSDSIAKKTTTVGEIGAQKGEMSTTAPAKQRRKVRRM